MNKIFRSLLTLAAAVALLTAVTASSPARRIASSSPTFRIVWASLSFVELVRCNLTLEGSFHERTVTKTVGALIGMITRATFGSCEPRPESGATVLTATLPWLITYEGFEGPLPNITRIRILLMRFEFLMGLLSGFVQCLYGTRGETFPTHGIANLNAEGRITGYKWDETRELPLIRDLNGSGLCPASLSAFGTGAVTQLGNSTPITIRLI